MSRETVGQLTRRRRTEMNMTQEDLADHIDMSQRWVSNLEADGVKQPRPTTLSKLARALNLTVADYVIALGHAAQDAEVKRVAEALTIDPECIEAKLLSYVREINWDTYPSRLEVIENILKDVLAKQRAAEGTRE